MEEGKQEGNTEKDEKGFWERDIMSSLSKRLVLAGLLVGSYQGATTNPLPYAKNPCGCRSGESLPIDCSTLTMREDKHEA